MQKIGRKFDLNPQIQRKENSHVKQQNRMKKQFTRFLQTYQEKKYVKLAQKAIYAGSYNLLIRLSDLYTYNRDIAFKIVTNYYRYETLLNQTLTQFMKNVSKQAQYQMLDQGQKDKNQQINKKPEYNKNKIKQQENNQEKITYQVSFDQGLALEEDKSIRNLKCEKLGSLRSIIGTVTRVSEVRPEMVEGVFTCMNCGRNSQKIIQQFKYTTPKKCLKEGCGNNSNWELNNKSSYFTDFQKVRVQEDSSKIPPGSMPRSIEVVLRNENTEKGQPGDQIEVVGYLNVIPDISSLLRPGQRTMLSSRNLITRGQNEHQGVSGIKGMRQLTYKLCFIGNHVKILNNQFNEYILTEEDEQVEQYDQRQMVGRLMNNFTLLQQQEILRIKQNPKIYQDFSQSLFHEIYGHSEIKKALLLQLLGGVHKTTQTKISIRGDINILIVGDPSTAKSQFLTCINKFVPRTVYKNGKTTTAAGLTASIVRDEDTGNISIQAGALLLANNGICCIDQFDKMQIKDQVVIHEAIKQQTISLAKAGIQATFHARTSILAAASPIFGRYNKSESLKKNINISPPIMSIFDLYFIICDQVHEQSDHNLSSFIVNMHIDPTKSHQRKVNAPPYDLKQIRNYLTVAKKIKPCLSHQAAQFLRKHYVELRKNSKQKGAVEYQVTVRQLQSMIRLSQAMAKMYLDMQIRREYVQQAFRLLDCSIVKLQKSVYELIDENNISDGEKITMGLYSALNETQYQMNQKRNKAKITIQQDVFVQIQKNIMELFKEKQRVHRYEPQKDLEEYLSQQDVIAYLMTYDLNTGNLSNSMQNNVKRIYKNIVNKLIKEQFLVVIEDSKELHLKKLTVHPKYFIENKEQQEKEEEDQDKNEKLKL